MDYKKDSQKQKRFIPHDLTGMEFGDLKVVERAENSPGGMTRWKCVCGKCGNERIVFATRLKGGTATMCNECRRKKMVTHGLSYDRIYPVWQAIIRRCENPNSEHFDDYGGRGITICKEWHDVEVFAEWAYKNGFDPNAKSGECTIERRDVNGNYCPDNCFWTNMKEQGRNKRNNYNILYQGKMYTLVELSEKYKIQATTLKGRLKRGWDIESALKTPVDKRTRGNKKSVKCLNDSLVFESLQEASSHYGISYDKLRRNINTQNEVDGYKFVTYNL